MNIPVIINSKHTRTGLAVKYPLGRIEEVILEEGKKIIGTCNGESPCEKWHPAKNKHERPFCLMAVGMHGDLFLMDPETFGCRPYWKKKEK